MEVVLELNRISINSFMVSEFGLVVFERYRDDISAISLSTSVVDPLSSAVALKVDLSASTMFVNDCRSFLR